ncbi:MAG: Maf family protein [Myxococcaceae bacterium]
MSNDSPSITLVLASGSPRRKELLERVGLRFTVETSDIDETPRPGESPRGYVKRLAREKAAAVAKRIDRKDVLVLAADTTVVLGKDILGKPKSADEAKSMLQRLQGQQHEVMTGVAMAGAAHDTILVETKVTFRKASSHEIAWYVATGEPMDKAGAYAVQGIGAFLVERLEGSPTNVIGLPVPETLELLQRAGFPLPWSKS